MWVEGKIKANWRLRISYRLHIIFGLVGFVAMLAAPHCVSFSTPWHKVHRFALALRARRRKLAGMSRDEDPNFQPRAGRIRDHGRRTGRRSQSFIAQVIKAAAKANGGPLTPAQLRGDGRRGRVGSGPRKGRCSRIGRGQAAADRLKRSAEQHSPSQRMRRVVVKARIIRAR